MTAWSAAALELYRSHAIPPEVAAELGWREIEPGELLDYGNGRHRSLNGAEPKVRQRRGQPLAVYWPEGRPDEPPDVVLAVEGETDAAAAVAALRMAPGPAVNGLAVAAVPGTGFPVTRLAEELAEVGSPPALLGFDADEAGRKYAERAGAALGEAGVRAMRLELPEGSDLADLLARTEDPGEALATLIADAQAAAEEVKFDPDTGEALGSLERLNRLSGGVEFLRVRQVGLQDARWYFTVRSRTGRPVELRSFTTTQICGESLAKLAARIFEARAGNLPTPRRSSDAWRAFMGALQAAAELEEHGATEAGTWRRRLLFHLDDYLRKLDPDTPEGKRAAITNPEPFEAPDGRIWVHAGAWLDSLERRRLDADDATVQAALNHLGFESQQLTAKVEDENRTRRYWRSPEGFDWRAEQ